MLAGLFLYKGFGLRERRVCAGLGVPTSGCDSPARRYVGQQGVWFLRARDEYYCVILDYEYAYGFLVSVPEMRVLR